MKTATIIYALALVFGVTQAAPYPSSHLLARSAPNVPTGEDAKSKLNKLTVSPSLPGAGYNRKLFPHWIMQHGECNTREEILKRDGTDVVVDAKCVSTSGTWVCPYTGLPYYQASDIDIDHMVPLKNAWISGASNWTTERRGEFANDLKGPQLWATKDTVNQAKSDSSPDKWKPPLESFYCTYASAWVEVKSVWGLTITEAEKAALQQMLNTCPGKSGNIFCK
ncbi:hypothetical protein TWF569_002434 [Orbilia oligospora]|uniref:GmrSD restriction endonucleases C-terminal domain-containing protein n=1 Tax=Orbilia oligospora TaxID=2813651 RepID=A0A7C8JLW9_ORBOL|nr:hypothetical protein TWF102_008231 [Orbilia oligospora]KAF3114478.1 hypothetical protein TWF706_008395 [Orbilia oligospora]KAF3114479.1 hypothetical protein TWF706_008395 [Orbilia oligospora]KAF3114733.1 hypothetical protein TWF103_000470 [Orbilia oligospora]KAF3122012.1 hypothetical protein TWF569_002434 [Orbilia oligospora]